MKHTKQFIEKWLHENRLTIHDMRSYIHRMSGVALNKDIKVLEYLQDLCVVELKDLTNYS